jgi:hypothetical protein
MVQGQADENKLLFSQVAHLDSDILAGKLARNTQPF